MLTNLPRAHGQEGLELGVDPHRAPFSAGWHCSWTSRGWDRRGSGTGVGCGAKAALVLPDGLAPLGGLALWRSFSQASRE